MRRYWLPLEALDLDGQCVSFTEDVFHHIFHVCRQSEGSRFEVLVKGGKAYFVQVTSVEKKKAYADILEERQVSPLPRPFIRLAVSVPQIKKIDVILEKAVELGVKEVVLFTSDFSSFKKDPGFLVKKKERWQKIIRGATQQSGRGELMDMRGPVSLEEVLQEFGLKNDALGLFAYEGECPVSVREYLSGATASGQLQELSEAWVFVGSEGGFSPREVDLFKNSGLSPVSLGEQILRVETACVVLPAILKYELGL